MPLQIMLAPINVTLCRFVAYVNSWKSIKGDHCLRHVTFVNLKSNIVHYYSFMFVVPVPDYLVRPQMSQE